MHRMNRTLILLGAIAAVVLGMCLRGAIAQDSTAHPGATRFATADVLGVAERLLLSDRYRPAQEAFTTEQNNKLKPLADELMTMDKKASTLPEGSPDLEALGRQFEQKRDEFQKARQEALAKIDAFNTDQVREAYRLTLQSVEQMAKRMGYTYVLASRTGAPVIRSDNVAGALQEILARPVAVCDPADDLTDKLIHEFKLENVKVDEATPRLGAPAGPPAPAPGPTPPPRR